MNDFVFDHYYNDLQFYKLLLWQIGSAVSPLHTYSYTHHIIAIIAIATGIKIQKFNYQFELIKSTHTSYAIRIASSHSRAHHSFRNDAQNIVSG